MALSSTKPGSRMRSPAIAINRPPCFTPRYRPSTGVRGPKGPGLAAATSASIAGTSSADSIVADASDP